jgi:hypothetical protein
MKKEKTIFETGEKDSPTPGKGNSDNLTLTLQLFSLHEEVVLLLRPGVESF